MSRCFPYRPTLCARNGGSGEEALIETIKLHSQEDKSKPKSLKDKKRERKEKKKERREKEMKPYGIIGDGNMKKHYKKLKSSQDENNSTLFSKKSEDEEHSEKSGLTDEHDEPVCYLSDGIQSSNKRKRQPSISLAPSTTSSITVHKNILRIRLPSLKHRESDPSLCKGQSCPTVGSTADSHVREVAVKEQCQIKNSVDDASPISDTLWTNGIAQLGASTCNGTTLYTKKVPDAESFYRAVIEDWVPPPIQSWLSENDNEDWLFGTKCQSQGLKRLKTRNDVSCRQSSIPWPCAHHLQEADVYALPYSIPF